MSHLDPVNRSLFVAARAAYEPTLDDRARLERALGIGVVAAVVAATPGPRATERTTASAMAWPDDAAMLRAATAGSVRRAKCLAALVLFAVGAAAGFFGRRAATRTDRMPALEAPRLQTSSVAPSSSQLAAPRPPRSASGTNPPPRRAP